MDICHYNRRRLVGVPCPSGVRGIRRRFIQQHVPHHPVARVSHQTLLVLDFGSQYTQLIARRLRELNLYTEIVPFHTPVDELAARRPAGLILSGGPANVREPGAPRCPPGVLGLGVPVLGICYGMQLMTDMLGGEVEPAPEREFGHATVRVEPDSPLFRALPSDIGVWASHGDRIVRIPDGFRVVATSANAPVAAMEDPARRFYALLFHPEVAQTERGVDILRNFAATVCGCAGDWTMASFLEEAAGRIRERVGDGRVVCGLSGGVDSTVAALLIHRAIGDRLTCIFRRQRPVAAERGGADPEPFRRPARAEHRLRRCGRTVSRRPRRPHRPRAETEDHRRDVHRRLRRRGAPARALRFSRPGHALSGRDRERVGGRPRRADQESPQRRGPARAHAVRPGGAAPAAVQG